MKKKLLTAICILLFAAAMTSAGAKPTINSDLTDAIKLYKEKNYSECYIKLDKYVKSDTTNALAYYYLAMSSAQLGREEEAAMNYDRAIVLTENNTRLHKYAEKGKKCLEFPDRCQEPIVEKAVYDSVDEEFILKKSATGLSDEVRSEYEQLKIENLMRDINRYDEIDPQKFKDYRDFSKKGEVPTDAEIVAALRVLQRAGLSGNPYGDISMLTGNKKDMFDLMGTSAMMNPQFIQAMLTNNMSYGY